MSTHEYETCLECIAYAYRRQRSLSPAIAEHCRQSGETGQECIDRYMTAVHARHLAGGSI